MKATAILAVLMGAIAGCSTSVPDIALEADSRTTALKQSFVSVDCGEDGVAAVRTSLEGAVEETLIGRGVATPSTDGRAYFAQLFELLEGGESAKLQVTVQPVRGRCQTSITDVGRGGVLFERDSDLLVDVVVLLQVA